jgi:hypothetical protein
VARLSPAADPAPAAWIVDSLTTFAESVLSLVPAGFDAYVRVFHPAYRREGEEIVPVRWAEIAAANGKQAHPAMQLPALTANYRFEENAQPGVFDHPPLEGSLPRELAERLPGTLSRHTTTPGRCWFAFWYGFGDLPDEARRAPSFETPGRVYHLFAGPAQAVADSVCSVRYQSANLWWPDDRAWCVATEIDLKTTYIGCSRACRDELLAMSELEAMEIDPSTGIAYLSDSLNPPARE